MAVLSLDWAVGWVLYRNKRLKHNKNICLLYDAL